MRLNLIILLIMLLAAPALGQSRIVGDLPRRDGRPSETIPGLETELGVVRTSEGVRLRSFVTRPVGTKGGLPAILVVQWVSCGTMEFPAERQTDLKELAQRSGLAMIRIDRSGTGDSEGQPCSALDYDTELRHYREAFDQLRNHRWIDPDRIIVYGISLGATLAPLIAEDKHVAGVMVQGGGAVTYLERMINFERLDLERSGRFPPSAVHAEMLWRIAFHKAYLSGKTPDQVVAERPELAGVWQAIRGGAEAPPHYGRPYAWHWQAARKNFLAAWAAIDAPVLVLYGEYDQFEPRHGHELTARTVNALRPGTATFIEIGGADHDLMSYASAEAAFRNEGGVRRRETYMPRMIGWLRKIVGLPVDRR